MVSQRARFLRKNLACAAAGSGGGASKRSSGRSPLHVASGGVAQSMGRDGSRMAGGLPCREGAQLPSCSARPPCDLWRWVLSPDVPHPGTRT